MTEGQDIIVKELEVVRQLLNQNTEQVQQALRLALTSASIKGIITRQGPHVACSAKLRIKHLVPIKIEQSLPQLSIALDCIARAERIIVASLVNGADNHTLLEAVGLCSQLLGKAKQTLEKPDPSNTFPQKLRPTGLPAGLTAEVYVLDTDLVLMVHQYQDTSQGHNALKSWQCNTGDPGLIAFLAKLDAGSQRIKHICLKLEAILCT